jgi:transcriptional regulator with XRE-family HTH domain
MTEEFPKRLQKLREKKGISRRVLAELCGLSKNMIALYENGKRWPNIENAAKLADCLGVSLDYLCGFPEK